MNTSATIRMQSTGARLATSGGWTPPIDDSSAREIVQPCRLGTKLAKVVAALQNPDGATIFQLMCCTGWQAHTIRGALSGMVRKKLRLNVMSTKAAVGERVYRID